MKQKMLIIFSSLFLLNFSLFCSEFFRERDITPPEKASFLGKREREEKPNKKCKKRKRTLSEQIHVDTSRWEDDQEFAADEERAVIDWFDPIEHPGLFDWGLLDGEAQECRPM